MTRRERRAERQRRFVTGKDARLAARLAHLDYKVTGETGALKVRSKVRTWHLGGRANGHAPPPGQGWDRSGQAHVVKARGLGTLVKPMAHREWRRLIVEAAPASTDR